MVAVAEALEVERFALARLERLDGVDAFLVLDPVERALFGAAVVGSAGSGSSSIAIMGWAASVGLPGEAVG